MTVLLSLLPALCLLGGVLLYFVPLPLFSRFRNLVPLVAIGLSGAAVFYLARTSADAVVLFEPSPILPGLTVSLMWNGPALPFGLFLLVLFAARLLAGFGQDEDSFVAGMLAVAAGTLLFLAADNFTTVAAAWIVVEVAMLAVRADDSEGRSKESAAFGWNLVAIVLWFAGGMMLSNQGVSLRLSEVTARGLPTLVLFAAIWIRSGLYPFHSAAPSDVPGAAVRLGVPLLLAGYLLTRLLTGNTEPLAFAGEVQILVVLAIALSAVLVAAQPHGTDAFVWLLRAFGAVLLLLPFLGQANEVAALSVWLTLGALALAVWVSIAWSWRAQPPQVPLTAIVWVIGLMMAAGMPLMPAFFGRAGLLSIAYRTGWAWWLLLVATATFYVLPLWREIFASREVAPRQPTRYEYAALLVALAPIVGVTVGWSWMMQPFGAGVQAGAEAVVKQVFSFANFNVFMFMAAGLVVPLLFSFEVARRRSLRGGFLLNRLAGVFDLSVPGRWLDRAYRLMRAVLQQGLGLLEQPPIAWLIFLAIWVAVWINTGLNP